MEIKGQVAVITGAGSGIGQAVAVSLAKRGLKALGLVDRNESVRTVAEMINQENGDGKEIAEAICCLISNSEVSGQLWADAGWHPPF